MVSDEERRSREEELVDRLERHFEAMNIRAYVDLYERPARLIGLSFLSGVARGVGVAVGFTLLGALLLYLLRESFVHNLPVVGAFIAHLVTIVQEEMRVGGGA
jgi:hypothetical protein